MFDTDTVERILFLIQSLAPEAQSYSTLELLSLVRILGEMASLQGMTDALQTFFAKNGLDRLNLLLQSGDQTLVLDVMWTLTNIACDSAEAAINIGTNDIFEAVVQKLESQNFHLRKEAIFVVGNVLTCLPGENLYEFIVQNDDMLTHYFSGMSMISNNGVLLSILATIDHFGALDIKLGYSG